MIYTQTPIQRVLDRGLCFRDPAGARLRYFQLRNRVLSLLTPSQPPWQGGVSRVLATSEKKRQPFLIAVLSVIPPGLEPGTPTLKVLCSTC